MPSSSCLDEGPFVHEINCQQESVSSTKNMTDHSCNQCPPEIGSVSYDLWSLGDLRLLTRCSSNFYIEDKAGKVRINCINYFSAS